MFSQDDVSKLVCEKMVEFLRQIVSGQQDCALVTVKCCKQIVILLKDKDKDKDKIYNDKENSVQEIQNSTKMCEALLASIENELQIIIDSKNVIPESNEIPNEIPINEPKRTHTFNDIVGCIEAKQCLFENVILPYKWPEKVCNGMFSGIRSGNSNILLYGPPGTGKTKLVEATANESNATLFVLRPSDILSKFHGESEKHIRETFEKAKAFPRSIIFFDEFDSIAMTRGTSADGHQARRLLSELLIQLTEAQQDQEEVSELEKNENDCFEEDEYQTEVEYVSNKKRKTEIIEKEDEVNVSAINESKVSKRNGLVVLAATNRLSDLDEAVLRRFDCRVQVGLPSEDERAQMCSRSLRGVVHCVGEAEVADISMQTKGWSHSDLRSLCKRAAMIPIREAFPMSQLLLSNNSNVQVSENISHINIRPVDKNDFEQAYEDFGQIPNSQWSSQM